MIESVVSLPADGLMDAFADFVPVPVSLLALVVLRRVLRL